MAAPSNDIILRADTLVKRFGGLAAVDGISFTLKRGEVLGIGGPNGAGKTTFFDLVSGLQPPTSGAIHFNGEDVTGLTPETLCHRGMARTFQLNAGFDSMTALENVQVAAHFGAAPRGFPGFFSNRSTAADALSALRIVGLGSEANTLVGDMPVLNRKLVMLAGALATKPDLLLMDEPVGGLTAPEIAIFEDVLATTRSQGMALVVIEHVMKFLLKLADRMLIMHQGRVLFDGPKELMLGDHKVIEVYLGRNAADRLTKERAGA